MREIEFRGFSFGDGPDLVRIAGPDGSARFRWGRWLTGSLVLWADRDASLLRSDPDCVRSPPGKAQATAERRDGGGDGRCC